MANEVAAAFDTAFRDYVTDGVPSSGTHRPAKSEVRGIGAIIDAQIVSIETETVAAVEVITDALSERVDEVEAVATAGIKWTTHRIEARSTANVDLATGLVNGQTLNGVTVQTGLFYFLGSQTDPAQNGIYPGVAAGTSARATFADSAAELAYIGFVVQAGTVGTGERWTLPLSAAQITLGTTALNFALEGIEPGYAPEVAIARGTFPTLGPRLDDISAISKVPYKLSTGIDVYRTTYVVTNNAPAATYEANGVVSVPANNGTLIFDIFITPTLLTLLDTYRMDIAVVSAGGTRIDGANQRQFNGATGLGAGVTNMVASGNDFISTDVAVEPTMTKVRVTIDNNPGTGTAKIYYPEVRLVRAADVPAAATIDYKAQVLAETTALTALTVNIAANGPYSMRKLAGTGADPTYNAVTGEITIPADVQAEIVYLNGQNIRTGDTVIANLKVVTDDTLAGTSGVFAIPVRQTAHSTGPGVVAELNRTSDNIYWQAVFLGNDADGNAPGSIVLRPDTRASGLKVAKQIVISDVWISPGTVRPSQAGLDTALTALRDAVTPEAETIDATEAANWAIDIAKASAAGRRVASKWVAAYGSDVAAGTEEAPYATIDKGLDNVVAGQTLALQGGVNHKVLAYRTITDINMVGIGSEPATIDGRQHITGSYTLVTGASYTKDLTFREATQNAGVASATWDYQVWDGEDLMQWIVGGADIAANKAVVDATPGSFTIYRTGSTVQDPRSDTNATGYTLYIHRGDGSDPTGADISVADIAIVIQIVGGVSDNIRIIGGAWKDFAKSSSTLAIPYIRNFHTQDFGQHTWVSAIRLGGYKCQFNGVPMPGMSGYTVGRASGEGLNIYTATYRNLDLVWDADIIEVNDSGYGIGGHGSGNQLYRSLHIPGLLRLRNCTNGVSIGQMSTTQPALVDGITIGEVDFQDGMDEAFSPGSNLTITRGGIIVTSNRSLNNSGNRTGIIKFMTSGEVFDATDLDVKSLDERPVTLGGTSKYLFWRGFTGNTAPTFRARGLQDKSAPGRHLTAFGNASSAFNVHIDLGPSANRPTIIGDLVPSYTATGYLPASITVAAGTTFGFAGMTRAEMRAFFDANLVPHNISNDTPIVGPMGEIVELPA